MNQGVYNLSNYPEMIAVAFELLLEVSEIGGGGVEPRSEKLPDVERNLRIRPKKALGIVKGIDRYAA